MQSANCCVLNGWLGAEFLSPILYQFFLSFTMLQTRKENGGMHKYPLDFWKLEDYTFHLPDLLLADVLAGVVEAAGLAVLRPAGTPVVPEPRTDGEVRQCACHSCVIVSLGISS
jgi:hypothetical protein